MSAQPTKHLEIETYTLHGVSVNVEINYDRRTISLLETREDPQANMHKNPSPRYAPKQWVFAHRTLEYVQGWQNILDAMKYAIGEAEKKLEKHVKMCERNVAKKEVDLMRAIAAEGKKNR